MLKKQYSNHTQGADRSPGFTEPECTKGRTFCSSKVGSILERWKGESTTEEWKRFSSQKGESTYVCEREKRVEIKRRKRQQKESNPFT